MSYAISEQNYFEPQVRLCDSRINQHCQIVFCRGAEQTAQTLKDLIRGGHLALIFDDNCAQYAVKLAALLKSMLFEVKLASYDIKRTTPPDVLADSLPLFVTHLIAVGGGSAAEYARTAALRRNIPFSIVALSPSTDSYLSLKNVEGETTPEPLCLVADETELCDAPPRLIACGHGLLFADPLRRFDQNVDRLFDGETLRQISAEPSHTYTPVALLEKLLTISRERADDSRPSPAEIVATLLCGKNRSKITNEYVFVASRALVRLYRSFLSADATDVSLPPDRIRAFKLIERKCAVPYKSCLKRLDISRANVYFKHNYILSEYREDLLLALRSLDDEAAGKCWRRLYPDAGYWLTFELTASELSAIVSLSGHLCGGLLGHICDSGFLESYV